MIDKKKLLLIGEVSKISQVSVKTIRHYDEIGLLSPVWVDPETHYRYYSQKQLYLLFLIQDLKSFDFSLKEIKEALKRESLEQITRVYLRKKQEADEQLDKLKKIKDRIDLRLDLIKSASHIEEDLSALQGTYVQLKRFDQRKIAFVRGVSSFSAKGIINRVSQLQKIISHKTESAYLIIFHESYENPDQTDYEVGTFMTCEEGISSKHIRILPAGLYACAVSKGAHKHSIEVYHHLLEWMKSNSYEKIGAPMKIYIRSLAFTESTDKILTEIQLLVRKIEKKN